MTKRFFGLLLLGLFVFAALPALAQEGPEKVLAKVETEEIREKEINLVIQMMGPQGAMMDNPEGRQAILDELVAARLFSFSGKKQGLDETPAFKEEMQRFTGQALARAAIEKLLADVNASEEEAKKFYDENPAQFTSPEEIHAAHILIADDETSADLMKKIQDGLKSGASFDALAQEYSTCPSAPQGGDLGFFQKGQMVPEFEAAAFALKNPGDVSEPVKTNFGWHIIKLLEKKPSALMGFDEMKPNILQYLSNEKKAAKYREELEALKTQYKVEIMAPAEMPASADAPASPDQKK